MTQENVSIAKKASSVLSDVKYTIGVCVTSAINSPLKLKNMENNQTPTKKQSTPTKAEDLDKRHPRKEFKGFTPNEAMIFGYIDYTPKDDYYG